jgi:hypothetical protein
MPQRALRATLFWIAAGFFLLGVASVVLRPASPQASSATATAEASPPPDAPQTTILILGVDDLRSDTPDLRAVWLAAHRPPGPSIYLFGLPTDAQTPAGAVLEDSFSWDPQHGPSPEFLSAVASLSPITLDITAVLDETAFASLIDFLGGVDLKGGRVGGREVVAVMEFLAGDASANLEAQRQLLGAMALRMVDVGPGAELQPLADLVPDHAYLSVPVADVLARLAPLLPLDPANILISLPLPAAGG